MSYETKKFPVLGIYSRDGQINKIENLDTTIAFHPANQDEKCLNQGKSFMLVAGKHQ